MSTHINGYGLRETRLQETRSPFRWLSETGGSEPSTNFLQRQERWIATKPQTKTGVTSPSRKYLNLKLVSLIQMRQSVTALIRSSPALLRLCASIAMSLTPKRCFWPETTLEVSLASNTLVASSMRTSGLTL